MPPTADEYRAGIRQLLQQQRASLTSLIEQIDGTLAYDWQRGMGVAAALYGPILDQYARDLDALRAAEDDPAARLGLDWLTGQRGKLASISASVQASADRYGATAAQTITQAQRQATEMAASDAAQLTQRSLWPAVEGAGVPPSVLFNRPNPDAIAQWVGRAGNGHPLGDLFSGFGAEATQGARQAMMLGLLTGANPKTMASGIANALGISRSRATIISRTEVLGSYRSAAHETYRANADVLNGWMWSAGGANPCAMCAGMDGQLFSLEEELVDHPCGKCAPIPVTKGWGDILGPLGIDTSDMEETSMGAEGAYTSISDRFASMPASQQRAIIGTQTGYEAYQRGEVELKDFIGKRAAEDGFPASYYQKSLKELEIPTGRAGTPLVERSPRLMELERIGKLRARDFGAHIPVDEMPRWAQKSPASQAVYQIMRNGLPWNMSQHELPLLSANIEQMLTEDISLNVRMAALRLQDMLGQYDAYLERYVRNVTTGASTLGRAPEFVYKPSRELERALAAARAGERTALEAGQTGVRVAEDVIGRAFAPARATVSDTEAAARAEVKAARSTVNSLNRKLSKALESGKPTEQLAADIAKARNTLEQAQAKLADQVAIRKAAEAEAKAAAKAQAAAERAAAREAQKAAKLAEKRAAKEAAAAAIRPTGATADILKSAQQRVDDLRVRYDAALAAGKGYKSIAREARAAYVDLAKAQATADAEAGGRGAIILITNAERDSLAAERDFTQLSKRMFGRQLTTDELGGLVGAPPGSYLQIALDPTDKNSLILHLHGPSWNALIAKANARTDYDAVRYLTMTRAGNLSMKNALFTVRSSMQGQGIGIQIFADEAKTLSKLGVKYITADAAGDVNVAALRTGWNGYYTWPRFGYTGKLDAVVRGVIKDAVARGDIPAAFGKYTTVQQFMQTEEARAAWKAFGQGMELKFDLTPGSYSMRKLDSYLAEKAALQETTQAAEDAAFAASRATVGTNFAEASYDLTPADQQFIADLRQQVDALDQSALAHGDVANIGQQLHDYIQQDAALNDYHDYAMEARDIRTKGPANVTDAERAWAMGRPEAVAAHDGVTYYQAEARYQAEFQARVLAHLQEMRQMGGTDLSFDTAARGFNDEVAQAIRGAQEMIPQDWIAASNDLGDLAIVANRDASGAGWFEGYANGKGKIALDVPRNLREARQAPSLGLHEMMHRMEQAIPRISQLEEAFYNARTAGEELVALENGVDAMTKVDQFIDPYVGRAPLIMRRPEYDSPLGFPRGSVESYEILSVGAEALLGGSATYDAIALREDEDFIHFILGLFATIRAEAPGVILP